MGLPRHGTKQCADLVCQSWLEWWVSRNDKTPVMFALRTVFGGEEFSSGRVEQAAVSTRRHIQFD